MGQRTDHVVRTGGRPDILPDIRHEFGFGPNQVERYHRHLFFLRFQHDDFGHERIIDLVFGGDATTHADHGFDSG